MDLDAFHRLFDQFEPTKAEAAMIHGLAATAGLSRWIDSGTLLGIERDGGFIAHDTDVDIAVGLTTDEALGLQLPMQAVARTIRWNHLPMQHAYLERDTIVDIYFYYQDIEPGLLVNVNTEGLLRLPAELVLPIDEEITWNGHSLPVPKKRREYLEWSFGASWTTPTATKGDWAQEHAHLDAGELADEWQLPGHHERIAALVGGVDAQRHRALVDRELALAERDRALVERDVASAQRDDAVAQRDLAARDSEQLRRDLDAIHSSRVWRLAAHYYTARGMLGDSWRRMNG